MEKIRIRLNGGIMPKKSDELAAAYDLYVPETVELVRGRQVIDMKFGIELPHGLAATIQPRSGFSAKGMEAVAVMELDGERYKEDVRVDADVIRGLVDENYRGSVGVIVKYEPDCIVRTYLKKGTRIAQMQIVRVPDTELVEVDELDMSNDRGGGFGHTGA